MFHDFKERVERVICKVTQEADAALLKVTQEADAAIAKVSEGADAAITKIHSTDTKDCDAFETALKSSHSIKEPSQTSIECAQDIFNNLFDLNNQLNKGYIDAKLDSLSLKDNILLVEDKDHYNLLHKAIIYNNDELLDILIEHKFDVSRNLARVQCNVSRRCPHYNLGAIHLACYLGRKNIVSTLIECGTDPQRDARIYTSALVNCPAHLQPRVLACTFYSNDVAIAARCGNREPVFFAVLGDHVEIVQFFLEIVFCESSRKPASQYSYLLQLACRVGSEKCIKYLLHKYPRAVNRADSDGLPPLVLVMRHKSGLYLTQQLLEAGADVHLLDDLWDKGNNILHLLYTSGLWVDEQTSLSYVSGLCHQQGVDVDAEDRHGNRPISHLLEQLNGLPTQPPFSQQLSFLRQTVQHMFSEQKAHGSAYLRNSDSDLILCIQQMIEHGCQTDEEFAHLNGNAATRYCASFVAADELHCRRPVLLAERRYGLDNTLKVTKMMINNSSNTTKYCFSSLVHFLGSVLYISPSHCKIQHSYDFLTNEFMLSGYLEFLNLILPHCSKCQLNSLVINQLPPLLFVLARLSDAPGQEGYVVPVETAEALSRLLRLLLEAGCCPQIEIENRHGSPRMIGCFDMLMQMLDTMQEYNRSPELLFAVKILTELLLEYGARTVVFRKLLYGASQTEAPWCYTTPSHSFLFQFLQFGALNLHYVGPEYEQLFYILCNQADGYVLQYVLNTVHSHFAEVHTQCECGECAPFMCLLQVLMHKCRSLKQLCRQVVLRHIPNYNPAALHTLPLPNPLRHYLIDFSQ